MGIELRGCGWLWAVLELIRNFHFRILNLEIISTKCFKNFTCKNYFYRWKFEPLEVLIRENSGARILSLKFFPQKFLAEHFWKFFQNVFSKITGQEFFFVGNSSLWKFLIRGKSGVRIFILKNFRPRIFRKLKKILV